MLIISVSILSNNGIPPKYQEMCVGYLLEHDGYSRFRAYLLFVADTCADYLIWVLKELYKKEARVSQFIAYPANQALALPTV